MRFLSVVWPVLLWPVLVLVVRPAAWLVRVCLVRPWCEVCLAMDGLAYDGVHPLGCECEACDVSGAAIGCCDVPGPIWDDVAAAVCARPRSVVETGFIDGFGFESIAVYPRLSAETAWDRGGADGIADLVRGAGCASGCLCRKPR